MLSANNKILGSIQRRCLYAEQEWEFTAAFSKPVRKNGIRNIWEHMLRDKECLLY